MRMLLHLALFALFELGAADQTMPLLGPIAPIARGFSQFSIVAK